MLHSPEMKRIVSGAAALDPLEAKRAEVLAKQAAARREVETLDPRGMDAGYSSVMAQLASLGLRKATKHELREIVMTAMERDPDA